MKIIRENKCFIEKSTLDFLKNSNIDLPESIGENESFKEFDRRSISFFKSFDFILDYDYLKSLNEDELAIFKARIQEDKYNLVASFNALSPEEKLSDIRIIKRVEIVDFALLELKQYINFIEGFSLLSLPSGVDYPKEYLETICKCEQSAQKEDESKLRRFFKPKN